MPGMVRIRVAVLLALALLPAGLAVGQESAGNGKGLYAKFCAACHGLAGKGDGPGAAALTPKPKDLTDKAYMSGLQESYLFEIVKKGGGAMGKSPLMPSWGAALKDDEIREVIGFVRSLAP